MGVSLNSACVSCQHRICQECHIEVIGEVDRIPSIGPSALFEDTSANLPTPIQRKSPVWKETRYSENDNLAVPISATLAHAPQPQGGLKPDDSLPNESPYAFGAFSHAVLHAQAEECSINSDDVPRSSSKTNNTAAIQHPSTTTDAAYRLALEHNPAPTGSSDAISEYFRSRWESTAHFGEILATTPWSSPEDATSDDFAHSITTTPSSSSRTRQFEGLGSLDHSFFTDDEVSCIPLFDDFTDLLWRSFSQRERPNGDGSSAATHPSPGSSAVSSSSAQLNDAPNSGPRYSKRVRNGRSTTPDDSESGRSRGKGRDPNIKKTTGRLPFACPFHKMDHIEHSRCRLRILMRIKDVKQHLGRSHYRRSHCPRCGEFMDEPELREHARMDPPCANKDFVRSGIDPSQSLQLSKRSDRRRSEEEQWYDIWDIIFPGHPRPASPFLKSEAFEYSEYIATNGPLILRMHLREHGCLGPESDVADEIVDSVLEGALEQILINFIGRQSQGALSAQNESTEETDPTDETEQPVHAVAGFAVQPNDWEIVPDDDGDDGLTGLFDNFNRKKRRLALDAHREKC